MILFPCRGVHTFFMKFKLDLLYVNASGEVVRVVSSLPPGRFGPVVREALYVIELPDGVIELSGTLKGHQVVFREK